MPTPPPNPPTPEQENRRHPRTELFAQVQVSQDADVYIMSTVNISLGGVFITGDPAEHPDLVPGATVDIAIFAAEDLGVEDAHLRGRVVRAVPAGRGLMPGFGVEFLPLQPGQATMLDNLLAAARRQ